VEVERARYEHNIKTNFKEFGSWYCGLNLIDPVCDLMARSSEICNEYACFIKDDIDFIS
jgi:hypothetical protein